MGTEPDWQRAGQALETRIEDDLSATYAAIARKAGMDQSYLWHIRKGRRVSDEYRRKAERAVYWPEGTLDQLAHDPTFVPPSQVLSDPERIESLEVRVREIHDENLLLREDVERLTRAVERIAEGLESES